MTIIKPAAHGAARAFGLRISGDMALGATGCCLAAASAAFGVGMVVHGPVVSLGTSKEFTVFAQLAPRGGRLDARTAAGTDRAPAAARPAAGTDDLDLTATASIPGRGSESAAVPNATIIPSVTLEAVSADEATVAFDGRTQVVRVGDTLPGAGEILAILPGAKPALKTSRGLIVPAAE